MPPLDLRPIHPQRISGKMKGGGNGQLAKEKGLGMSGAFLRQWAGCLSQSSRLGSVSKVCSGGGEGRVHSSVSACSFQ